MKQKIINYIKAHNDQIAVDQFMQIVLYDSEIGYYMHKNPIGKGGDFTTSPEISQLFGEIIAIWVLTCLEKLNFPLKFNLVEIGPGKASLSFDILRVLQKYSKVWNALNVTLIEISPYLQTIQKDKLISFDCKKNWLNSLENFHSEYPTIIIANELFDALPVKHYISSDREIDSEIFIKYNPENDQFYFDPYSEQVYEYHPKLSDYANIIKNVVEKNKGAACIIDYGYLKSNGHSTLQAVKEHKYCDIFEHLGEADITAHVNFGGLQKHLSSSIVMTQREFLISYGIELRTQILASKNPQYSHNLHVGKERLISHDEMGELFKVLLLENY